MVSLHHIVTSHHTLELCRTLSTSLASVFTKYMATTTAVLPALDHLSLVDYDHIYEPAEDTFLTCDALLQERGFLEALRPTMVMEIGSGSGRHLHMYHIFL